MPSLPTLSQIYRFFTNKNDPVEDSIWISIEGNISSGKTTLLNSLKDKAIKGHDFGLPGYDIRFIDEDIDAWGEIFKDFYQDPKRWAFTFQFKVICVRIKQYRDICSKIRDSGKPSLVISERSLESSRYVFAQMCNEAGNISSTEKIIYDSCYAVMNVKPFTDLYVYCITSPEICKDRYTRRDRKGEKLDFKYLVECDRYHSRWLKTPHLKQYVVELDNSKELCENWLDECYIQICLSLNRRGEHERKLISECPDW